VATCLALAAACALAAAGAFGAARTGERAIEWRGGFETGDLSQWTLAPQEKDPSRIVVVEDPHREGRYAVRVTVTPDDRDVAGSGSGQRAELAITQVTTDGFEGREQWWAWSTMFAPDFTSRVNKDWNVFTQFHNTGTTGQANMHWSADGGVIRFRACNGDVAAPRCRIWTIDRNRQNGRWYDFVFHVRWSSAYAAGLVEVWENGRKVVPLTHLRTLYPGQGVYLKQGYYRVGQDSTAVLYHDGMRRASSYAAVVKDFPSGEWPATPPETPRPHAKRR